MPGRSPRVDSSQCLGQHRAVRAADDRAGERILEADGDDVVGMNHDRRDLGWVDPLPDRDADRNAGGDRREGHQQSPQSGSRALLDRTQQFVPESIETRQLQSLVPRVHTHTDAQGVVPVTLSQGVDRRFASSRGNPEIRDEGAASSLSGSAGPRLRSGKRGNKPGRTELLNSEEFRNTISFEVYSSARKHGVADEDVEHAVRNAMAMEGRGENRILWIGPAMSAELIEVITVRTEDGRNIAIHAMPLRRKYERLLPERS